jgi:hypothetical protein
MWSFDLAAEAWTKMECKGVWTPSRAACYIPEEDVIFLVTFGEKDKPSVHQVFRCASGEWVHPEIALRLGKDAPFVSWDTGLAWDPVHKVVVMVHERGFGGPTMTLLLRYDGRGPR